MEAVVTGGRPKLPGGYKKRPGGLLFLPNNGIRSILA
jgi:hypothetical protein